MSKNLARIMLAVVLAVLLSLASLSVFAQTAHTPVGNLGLLNNFGYSSGKLVYGQWWKPDKSVEMGEQASAPEWKCPKLIEKEEALTIKVTVAFNPSILWEMEYHRLVAIYGALGTPNGNKDIVTKDDLKAGLVTYLGQWQKDLCVKATQKSIKELLVDPSVDTVPPLSGQIKADLRSPFEIKIQMIEAIPPKALVNMWALKGLEKSTPAPAPAVKKAAPTPVPVPQNNCCCTTAVTVITAVCVK